MTGQRPAPAIADDAMPSPPPSAPAPDRPFADRIAAHKYSLTMGAIILAHIGLAALGERHTAMLAPMALLVLYFLGFLFLLARERSRLVRVNLTVGGVALALSGINMYYGNRVCLTAALAGHTLFVLLLIVFMLNRLFREKLVSVDTIMAGIIVYLLMAGLWAQLYALLLLADPGAINIPGGVGPYPFITLYYYSVTTLTTAGFGDVAPLSPLARILAGYESLVGQVYLGVFIALLMGRHFARS